MEQEWFVEVVEGASTEELADAIYAKLVADGLADDVWDILQAKMS